MKLFDSELKVMEYLWNNGDLTAGTLAKALKDEIGWNRNTTYTVIKKCINKGAIERLEPNFICSVLISKEEVQKSEILELINKLFNGSAELLFIGLVKGKHLTAEQINKLL